MKKSKIYLLITILSLSFNNLNAQYSEKQSFVYNGVSYEIFKIKQDSLLADKCSFVENQNSSGEKSFFSSIANNNFFAITSSIVDSACKPLGLFIQNGKTLSPTNTSTQGIGTFYSIQPNGIFYINQDNEFNINSTPDFVQANPTCKLAIQSGTMLVDKGTINSQFTKASKNKYTRCGVGISSNKEGRYIIFVKSNSPVNFYAFADLFLNKLNCYNALNLESGTNCSIHLPSHTNLKFSNKIKPCRYFMIDL
jgi:uncharacterized protein YigE (DUF2233 family)